MFEPSMWTPVIGCPVDADVTAGMIPNWHQWWLPGRTVWWCVPQIFAIQLQPEDIIIAGTDGLFDNVFPEESAALMRYRFQRVEFSTPGMASSTALAADNRAA